MLLGTLSIMENVVLLCLHEYLGLQTSLFSIKYAIDRTHLNALRGFEVTDAFGLSRLHAKWINENIQPETPGEIYSGVEIF